MMIEDLESVSSEQHSLAELFAARSVVIVGASARPGSWGRRIVEAMVNSGFEGTVYAVNPRRVEVLGLKSFRSVRELPEQVDLAIVMVSPERMPGVVEDCAAAHVRSVIALTTGFAETGQVGEALEDRIGEIVDEHGMRFIGPNCLGVLDSARGLNCYFREMPARGDVAVVAQGGGLGAYMCEFARRAGVGVSKFVSLGNQLRTTLVDCAALLANDNETRAVTLYVEGAPRTQTRHFMRALVEAFGALAETKPVVVFQGGQTPLSSRLAYSHTAAMATSAAMLEGVCRQYGLHVADTPANAVVLAGFLATQRRLERPKSAPPRRVAIVGSGSQGMYVADLCHRAGLDVPDLGDPLRLQLAAEYPDLPELRNPLDFAGVASSRRMLPRVLELLAAAEHFDAIVYGLPSADQVAHIAEDERRELSAGLAEVAASGKPVVAVEWLGPCDPDVAAGVRNSGQLFTDAPEDGIGALRALGRQRPRASSSGLDDSNAMGSAARLC